jgi:glycosyltransferase involved in cell wall biosynthesis
VFSNGTGVRTGRLSLAPNSLPSRFKSALQNHLIQKKLARLGRVKQRFRCGRSGALQHLVKTPLGVNLVAYIRAEMGLGQAARGVASALEAACVPFNIINLEEGNCSSHRDYSWVHKEVRKSRYDITLVCVNPDNGLHLRRLVSTMVLGDRFVVGNWFWELPDMPDVWMREFEFTDEVWVASKFSHNAFLRKSPVPVVLIPPVVQLSHRRRFSRSQLGLPQHRFLFLAMFDRMSILPRKNPLGVLHAFKRAFSVSDNSVGLVLKFNNADDDQSLLHEIQAQIEDRDDIYFVNRTLDRDALSSLIEVSDCFVSLHRSEGFGLGPAEAMSLGKPAIITNWSGNTDYMTADNCIAIDYKLTTLGKNYGPYTAEQQWAEVDLNQAAYWMKKVVAEPSLANHIGRCARETIVSRFSAETVGRIIRNRLNHIRRNQRGANDHY